jgi:hypothetical protein
VLNVVAFSLLMLRAPLVPRWVAGLGFLAGLAHLVAAGSFAHGGLFAPEIMANLIAPALYVLWVLATGMALVWRSAAATAFTPRRTPPLATRP